MSKEQSFRISPKGVHVSHGDGETLFVGDTTTPEGLNNLLSQAKGMYPHLKDQQPEMDDVSGVEDALDSIRSRGKGPQK